MNLRPALCFLLATGCTAGVTTSSEEVLSRQPTMGVVLADREVEGDVVHTVLGDPVTIRLHGLAPGGSVTLRAESTGFASSATFHADASGTVDTASQSPVSGSYAGADGDGLFWSMTRATTSGIEPMSTRITAEVGDRRLTVRLAPGFGQVAFEKVDARGGQPGGILARPPASNGVRSPAILVLHGSEGNTSSSGMLAGFLATRGWVAFAPVWFGQAGQPEWVDHVPLETFGSALDWLRAQPGVDPSRVAVVGTSRGGEAALQVGAHFDVQAVVGIVPSGIAVGEAWSYRGEELPTITPDMADVSSVPMPDGRTASRQRTMYLPAISADPAAAAKAEIAVERTPGPVLLLGGADDGVWPSCELSKIAFDRLARAGRA